MVELTRIADDTNYEAKEGASRQRPPLGGACFGRRFVAERVASAPARSRCGPCSVAFCRPPEGFPVSEDIPIRKAVHVLFFDLDNPTCSSSALVPAGSDDEVVKMVTIVAILWSRKKFPSMHTLITRCLSLPTPCALALARFLPLVQLVLSVTLPCGRAAALHRPHGSLVTLNAASRPPVTPRCRRLPPQQRQHRPPLATLRRGLLPPVPPRSTRREQDRSARLRVKVEGCSGGPVAPRGAYA